MGTDANGLGSLPAFAQDQMIRSSEFFPFETFLFNIDGLAQGDYIIAPCTYKPDILGKFTLLVFSTEELVFKDAKVKAHEAGRLTDRLPKSKRTFAMPMGYDSTPPKTLREDVAMKKFDVRSDSAGNVFIEDD
jgi:hypothetical protein